MSAAAREAIEREVRTLCAERDYASAATRALRGYGAEILGFLVAVHRDEADADDAFSEFAESLWRALPGFAWGSTLRTWAYGIARNVSRTRRRNAARRARRAPHASESALERVAQCVRTDTLAYLRTAARSRLEALRDSLPEDDRALLVLRVDREFAWNDLARVLSSHDEPDDDAAVAREAARLRKRFQLVKERLREMAKREGLIA